MQYLVQMKLATYSRPAAREEGVALSKIARAPHSALQDLLRFSFPPYHNAKFT